MKKSFVQKHPYIASILVGLLCTFMTALGMAVPQIMGLDTYSIYIVATVFLLISVAIGVFIMTKSKLTLVEYGFRISENRSSSNVWWYAPLLALEVLPIAVYGFSPEITPVQYIILAFFTIAIGLNEEIYFRGLALKFLAAKGGKRAIIFSSIIFGVLHLINALNGKNVLYLVLQMLFALLVGFVLAEIVSITKSLWIVIIWHAAHDYISNTTSDSLDQTALIILAIQLVILLIYAIGIWKRTNVPENVVPGEVSSSIILK
ncbi:CPBP family intramembrane glutamic endopeptidase [Paenibacillus puldeungensis]|uniref:CPBP family intramembrane glutamic endopeptidase n=1 Tax=Paenibacillus puldeungensis TaxID=696536 RepID=A0ABW3RUL6_9BACL